MTIFVCTCPDGGSDPDCPRCWMPEGPIRPPSPFDLLDRADRLLASAGRHPAWAGYAQSVTAQAADLVREVISSVKLGLYDYDWPAIVADHVQWGTHETI